MKKILSRIIRSKILLFSVVFTAFVNITPTHSMNSIPNVFAFSPEEVECITEAVYFEARGESLIGRKAVIEVILNRMENPSRFSNTACGVVKQHKQFSYRGMKQLIIKDQKLYEQIRIEVKDHLYKVSILGKRSERVVKSCSNHYDGTSSNAHWIKSMTHSQQVGNHIFYCDKGDLS